MTAELAADPRSLVFLDLAEALRVRGQPEPAAKVARTGLARYPELADAHDVLARILADLDDVAGARAAWERALALAPGHAGASKGLAFLLFRAGDPRGALPYLEAAQAAAPHDAGIPAALARVRALLEVAEGLTAVEAPAAAGPQPPSRADGEAFEALASREAVLLFDAQGQRLAGGMRDPAGRDVGDAVAAHLAGVSREAARTARLLDLGAWQGVAAESRDGHLLLVPPAPDAVLLVARDPSVPVGRLVLEAEQAARGARAWLERLR